MDKGHVTLLALFDVTAAFDTVDHGILLERLETSFGVVGRPLLWLRAFLTVNTVCGYEFLPVELVWGCLWSVSGINTGSVTLHSIYG